MLLIGRNLSPFVRRCATVFNLLELPYKQKSAATEEDGDYIREHNPLGRVPALLFGSRAESSGVAVSNPAIPRDVIIDSSAIIDYALEVSASGATLLAPGGQERQQALYLSSVATGVMEKAVAAAYEVRMRPKELVHTPYLERLQGQAIAGLVELNSLAQGDYFGGGLPGLADVNAVIAYDQVKIVAPSVLAKADLPKLALLSDKANQLSAFASTRWQPAS